MLTQLPHFMVQKFLEIIHDGVWQSVSVCFPYDILQSTNIFYQDIISSDYNFLLFLLVFKQSSFGVLSFVRGRSWVFKSQW